jgi:hypothetical protein
VVFIKWHNTRCGGINWWLYSVFKVLKVDLIVWGHKRGKRCQKAVKGVIFFIFLARGQDHGAGISNANLDDHDLGALRKVINSRWAERR